MYDLKSYQFDLPENLIAQTPAGRRDQSRLLHYDGLSRKITDLHFFDICRFFKPGDVLVVNNTKVFPARLLGRKETGGKVELLLLAYPNPAGKGQNGYARAFVQGLVKSSKRPRSGSLLLFSDDLYAEVVEIFENGKVSVNLYYKGNLDDVLGRAGQLPLPPYIDRSAGQTREDRRRYQTVYARTTGAVAAPTAGLHFTEEIFQLLRDQSVMIAEITLHVGYGTFAPVRTDDIRDHRIHSEFLSVSRSAADLVNQTRRDGGRVWAVGTTSVRCLEFAADENGQVQPFDGDCDLYIYPGYQFRVVENLITNFHLPGSSLLFLVSSLIGRDELFRCYDHAVKEQYRFFSYGDAMVITL
jgi:S-adenosylmethionine:tRNA ribosyltransferase-isomerase